jgi:hypothetical protein
VSPSEASQTFSPVEATSDVTPAARVGKLWFTSVVSQEDVAGVPFFGSDEIDALPALGYAHRPSVYDTVSPLVVELFECRDDVVERLAAMQLKHERHVLKKQPSYFLLPQEAEDLVD